MNQQSSLCIAEHESLFFAYAAPFCPPDCLPLQVKLTHTRQVLANAAILVKAREHPLLVGDTARAALLAALYHDVARFEQFTRYGTFRDADSVNHGALGAQIIRRQGFLDTEPPYIRRLARIGVCLHNRYRLPKLGTVEGVVTAVVRDADKIDIFRVMAQHLNAAVPSGDVLLHVKNEPDAWSPAVADMIMHGQVPNYADLHYVNDFRMLLVSWLRDLGFSGSCRRLAETGTVEPVLQGLPDSPAFAPMRDRLCRLLDDARHGKLSGILQ